MTDRIIALCLLLLVLTGCQTLTMASGPAAPPLVPPQKDMAILQLSQRLTIRTPDDNTRRMLAVTTLTPDRLQLNGLSITGQRLFEIRWDGKSLDTWQAPGVEKTLPAEWLLAQIQLAYFPEPVLRQYYRGIWSLQTETEKRHLQLEEESNITVTCRAPLSGGRNCLVPDTSVLIDHHRSGLFIRLDALKVVEQVLNRDASERSSSTGPLTAERPERSRP